MLAVLKPLLPLLLALAEILPDLLGWRVLDEIALLVESGPFGQTIGDVNAALAVEHVKSDKGRSVFHDIKTGLLKTYLGAKFFLS